MVPEEFKALSALVAMQLDAFPDHREFLERRFHDATAASLGFCESLAGMIARIGGDQLADICTDYRWLTGIVLEEEMYFRRNDRYRRSTFAEAYEAVYGDRVFMGRYANALLVSQVWWANHTEVIRWFHEAYLGSAPEGFTHLEVGPGHGLLLALAASSPRCASAEGWDVSDASVAATAKAIDRLGLRRDDIVVRKIDLFDHPPAAFDSIACSEVLEHLEDPMAALRALRNLLKPQGRIFINAPVNSPAPDHIYLFRKPEELVRMIGEAGFRIEDTLFSPCTGATLDRAMRWRLTVSVAVIAKNDPDPPHAGGASHG